MTFDIAAATDQCAQWVTRSRLLSGLVRNPFLVALLITAVVFVILYAVLDMSGASWKSLVRGGLYALVAVTLIMFLHNYIVGCEARATVRGAAATSILQGIEQNMGAVPVEVTGRGDFGDFAPEDLLPGGVSLARPDTIAPTRVPPNSTIVPIAPIQMPRT